MTTNDLHSEAVAPMPEFPDDQQLYCMLGVGWEMTDSIFVAEPQCGPPRPHILHRIVGDPRLFRDGPNGESIPIPE